VLVTDFSVVDAVAASPWTVYVATRRGLLLYDRRAGVWGTPVTSLDGFPAARVRVALADPAGNAVWLGTDDGWARYDADLLRWDAGVTVGGVTNLMLDARDAASGVFMRDQAGWRFLPRGAQLGVAGMPLPPPERRVEPLDVRVALAAAPAAEALRAQVLTDPQLRVHRFTAAARSEDGGDWFFGTDGLGLVRFDATMGQWEPLAFTLLGPGVGALAAGLDGVWAASAARFGARSGVTWVPEDLSSTTLLEPPAGSGFGSGSVRRLLAAAGALWVATDAGLFRLDPASGRAHRFDLADGLPSEEVRSLAPAPDGVWVGTRRGLVVVAGDRVTRVGGFDRPVLSLLAVRETLWVGGGDGLGLVPPGGAQPVVPPAVQAEPALRAPVVALARTGDTIVALLEDQVAWRDAATGRWTVERPRVALGTLTSAAGDVAAGGVWLGGMIGLAWWDVARGVYRRLDVPGDLPAPVRDVAVAGSWVWVATDSGLVRLRAETITGGGR
jgi:ligand-binding sensor domain-containing protein